MVEKRKKYIAAASLERIVLLQSTAEVDGYRRTDTASTVNFVLTYICLRQSTFSFFVLVGQSSKWGTGKEVVCVFVLKTQV